MKVDLDHITRKFLLGEDYEDMAGKIATYAALIAPILDISNDMDMD